MQIQGQIVDIPNRRIYSGEVTVENGKIVSVSPKENNIKNYILPGFVDAHIHIESSMLVPSEFAKLAVLHGTVGTISDPHEIANVLGKDGVHYMIENGKQVPLHLRPRPVGTASSKSSLRRRTTQLRRTAQGDLGHCKKPLRRCRPQRLVRRVSRHSPRRHQPATPCRIRASLPRE